MTPAAKPRVSDMTVLNLAASCAVNDATVDGALVLDLALDLRDARAEAARWRECAEALAEALKEMCREEGVTHDDPECPEDDTCVCPNVARINAALARFDTMTKEAG